MMTSEVIVITPDGRGRGQSDPAVEAKREKVEARLEAEKERKAEAAREKAEQAAAKREERSEKIQALRERKRELVADLTAVRGRLAQAKAARSRAVALGEGNLEALRGQVADLEAQEEELVGGCDIVDDELAGLDHGARYGRHRVVSLG